MIMKRISVFIMCLFYFVCTVPLFAQSVDTDSTEISIYNEIISYKNTGYYPGVVDRTDFLKKNYPESVFINPALVLKGEALVNLGRFAEAVETFHLVIPSMHLGSEDFSKTYYLLGKAYYFLQKNDLALDSFFKACSISEKEEKYDYYEMSLLYVGRIYFLQKDYEKAVPLFEYITANGKNFTLKTYQEVLQKLFVSYSNTGRYARSIELYEQLNEKDFPKEIYSFFTMYAAESCEKSNEPQKAYRLYNTLIDNENQNISVAALKKAYVVASQNNINVEPADVLDKITSTKPGSEGIIADFWVRVGIDSYNTGDFDKARECFELAKASDNAGSVPAEDEKALIITLYEARMTLEETKNTEEKITLARKLETQLSVNEEKYTSSQTKNLSGSYYAFLIYCRALKNEWRKLPELYEKIEAPDARTVYLTATAYFRQRDYAKAESIIITDLTENENKLLYASILSKLGKYKEAEAVYEKLYAKKELPPQTTIEYSKVLYKQRKWEAAEKTALEAKQPQSYYLAGLCELNRKKYAAACDYFTKHISSSKEYVGEAVFYRGYAYYNSGDYKTAYSDFVLFNNKAKEYKATSEMSRNAYNLAAKAALRFGDFDKASAQAEALILATVDETERYNAAVFCSQIYADKKDYEKAVSTLEPFTKKQTPTAISALFQIANIYESAGDDEKAEAVYKDIYTDFGKTPEAEEAMYRCGELYYSKGNYRKAEEGFTKYIYSYINGRFSDAAYYFSGESNLKLGDNNRSIMQNETLLSKYPQSIYAYGALKNLVQAYYLEAQYEEALSSAEKLINKNRKQAEADGIVIKAAELKQIVAGTDKRIVEKQSEFTQKGELATEEGRIAGTELVALYSQYEEYYQKGVELAEKLLPLQVPDGKNSNGASRKSVDEILCGAKNADFLGLSYDKDSRYKEAAEMYLKAAECYRLCGKAQDSAAAASLYSAVAAFVSAGLNGDAKATAKLLGSLYPDSKQAKRVDALVK